MKKLAWTALVLALAPLVYAGAAPNKKLESWFEFRFHNKKVGFVHAVDEPTTYEGRAAVHSMRRSLITVRRQDNVLRMEATTDAWSEPDGKPIRFTHLRMEAGAERKLEGTRDGNTLIVRVIVGGALSEKRHPLTGEVYLSASLDHVFKKDMKVGKKLVAKAIIEEDGELRPFTAEVTGTEKTPEGEAFVVESEVAGVKSRDLVLADGRTLRSTVARLGAEHIAKPREVAMALEDPADIFLAARLETGVQLPKTETLDELSFRLNGRSGEAPAVLSDERQIPGKKKGGTLDLRVLAVEPPSKPMKLPIKDPKLARYLSETPYEALKDERLIQASRAATEGSADAWEAATRINKFVYRHIKNKSLAQAFSTANEALESREGDCTEHAVLFSALAKIAGIPTRLATGLVYVGSKEGIFGYHEWVEVWVGKWIPMDPTFGQDLADPTHIKFSQGISDAEGLREAGIAAAALFGDLELKVISAKIDGKITTF